MNVKRHGRALKEIERLLDETDRIWQHLSFSSSSREEVMAALDEWNKLWCRVTHVITLIRDDECIWENGVFADDAEATAAAIARKFPGWEMRRREVNP